MTFPRVRVPASLGVILLLLLGFVFAAPSAVAQDDASSETDCELWQQGKDLFRANCASCHHPVNDMTGPALAGSLDRWEADGDYDGIDGKEWLYRWIKNNTEVLESGHPYANDLYNEWDQGVMNLFPTLTESDIDAILYYVDRSTECGVAPPVTADAEDAAPAGSGFPIQIFLLLVVGALLVLLLILLRVNTVLRRMEAKKNGIELAPAVPIWKNRKLAVLVVLVGVVFLGYVTMDGAINIGRQQGYQPEQPIKFSHELHAGLDQIDCQYCHYGANESKHSNIPSVNTCMNCHKVIQEGPNHGRTEIAKIYAANGYDPIDGSYLDTESVSKSDLKSIFTEYLEKDYEETELGTDEVRSAIDEALAAAMKMYDKPVEWIRIHNLPDHVYFNHAQHVNAGNVECQTCHGPVEEMEVLYQHAPLSMGWCINCHRETAVDFANNDYYSVYERFHEELASGEMDKVTVEDVGGTECQKCHY